MSIINNGLLLASGADAAVGYQISRSLRFNGTADSTYLNRTFSTGNRKTWTWSGWVKRSTLSSGYQTLFSGGSGGGRLLFGFGSGDTFSFELQGTGSHATTAVFRDPSAWYHVVVAFDTTQATAADRTKVWINNTLQTLSGLTFSQNTDYAINSNVDHRIGCQTSSLADFFNGYLADIYLLDGTATTPSTFAETDAVTGQWVAKTPSGISYGTNGFRLTFSDNSGTTSTTLGKDAAGSNNWSPNNFSVASGSGNDSLVDSPTSYGTDTGAGGEVRANYATLNPLNYTGTVTLSNGNLDASGSNANASSTIAPNAGKWYAEFVYSAIGAAVGFVGISNRLGADAFNGATQTWQLNYTNTGKLENAASQSTVSTFTTGDVVGVAFDCSNGQATFYKNGSSVGTITGSAFVGVPVLIGAGAGGAAGTNTFVANFGQRPFAYTAPSGYKALCDTNLPTPTIAKPSTVMDVVLYTGTGSSLTPTSTLGFNPDLIWIKSRSAATDHALYDAVRGAQARLESNTTDAEVTSDGGVTAFNSAGFTVGTLAQVNTSSATYAAWTWDAGTSTVTNTQGSITSQVRANPSAGFSIVTYTGNSNSSKTIGHGLNTVPSLMIVKCRTAADGWVVYHKDLGNTSTLQLQSTNAIQTSDTTAFASTTPTSTVFTVGNSGRTGDAGRDYVAYLFSPVAGYSAMGSYVSTGTSDNVFNFCGFKPRFLLLKNATVGNSWVILDSARSTFNAANDWLGPNSSSAEDSNNAAYSVDFLSNGFKVRSGNGIVGNSGDTVVWAAFAESPFQYARAR